ncbi:MAG TPA: DUF721 domain-containing protein [bacterium]|nr:DUF721 domain-containing protein [bacterium]HPQ65262.1 DUF721 domain-containing protein [bacterium]
MGSAGERGGPVAVGDVLEGLLDGYRIGGLLAAGRVLAKWEDAVGAAVARHARPGSFREGTLTVLVDSSAWLYQLERFHKRRIIESLNSNLGRALVTGLIFRIGGPDNSVLENRE